MVVASLWWLNPMCCLVVICMSKEDRCSKYVLDINFPRASCADIYNKNPTSHGRCGYYVLKTDHLFFAYCNMELDCGGTKGWRLIKAFKYQLFISRVTPS